jgi:Ca-activated chloride channel family protein
MRAHMLNTLKIMVLLWTTPVFAQTPSFSVSAEEVRMDVLVTEDGKPVADLKAVDFEVLDNGVLQEIRYVTLPQEMPISTTLVLDMSGSVAGTLLDHLKDAAHRFLDDLKHEDKSALITFNQAVILKSPLTNDLAKVKQALDATQPFGNSSLQDASYAGLTLAESRFDAPLLVIFSDGLDTFSWLTEAAVLETAKRNNTVVYAVSTDKLPPKAFLRELTEVSGGLLYEVGSPRDLATVFLRILQDFRQRYLITYSPRGVSNDGWHKLEVHVKRRSARVRVRPGYMRGATGE